MAILIPTGGLGNRIRFLNSATSLLNKSKKIVIINFSTDMFPGKIDRYIELSDKFYIVYNLNFISEKLLIRILRISLFIGNIFGIAKRYGTRSISSNEKRIISSCHVINGGDISSNPLKKSYLYEEWRNINLISFNAVHIRRGDNKRSIRLNQIEKYKHFINASKLPVYLATDDKNLKKKYKKIYKSNIITTDVIVDRSNSSALDEAFFELCILVNAKKFIGSTGSSFSSVADAYRDKNKN